MIIQTYRIEERIIVDQSVNLNKKEQKWNQPIIYCGHGFWMSFSASGEPSVFSHRTMCQSFSMKADLKSVLEATPRTSSRSGVAFIVDPVAVAADFPGDTAPDADHPAGGNLRGPPFVVVGFRLGGDDLVAKPLNGLPGQFREGLLRNGLPIDDRSPSPRIQPIAHV